MDNDQKELCTIRIMFPVSSAQQALNAKKKIAEALKDIEGTQLSFTLMSKPNGLDIRPTNNRPLG